MAEDNKGGERQAARRAPAQTQPGSGTQVETTGVAEEARTSHERRTTVPGRSDVDARLDNRVGSDRPKREEWPAKPQQVDGPDIVHQVEHTKAVLEARDREDHSDRRGMFAAGPHGLSDEKQRKGEAPASDEGFAGKTTSNEDGETTATATDKS